MKDTSRKRHIAKTLTWRLVGTFDTIVLSWIISGNPFMALKIGGAEVISKMLLYYFHERLWFNTSFFKSKKDFSHWRHIAKTISWRIIGTLDTMLLAWIISGDPMIGLKIGLVEVTTKMILYYFHERVWYRINYGLTTRSTKSINDE